jgi:hypothetical protein
MTWRRDQPHADPPPPPNLLPTNMVKYSQHMGGGGALWTQWHGNKFLYLPGIEHRYSSPSPVTTFTDVLVQERTTCTLKSTGTAWSQDSSVGIATGWKVEFRFPARAKYFSPFHIVQTGSGAHPASYPVGTRGKEAEAWRWPFTSIQCRSNE